MNDESAPLRPGTRPVGAATLAVEDTSTDGLNSPPPPRVTARGPKTGAAVFTYLLVIRVIREDPAVRSSCVRGRGTETSAEVLVGPPWRMESNAGQQQWY